jgi:hypothetical protein
MLDVSGEMKLEVNRRFEIPSSWPAHSSAIRTESSSSFFVVRSRLRKSAPKRAYPELHAASACLGRGQTLPNPPEAMDGSAFALAGLRQPTQPPLHAC